jgi:pentafunctional AROM polypeptide
MAFSVLAIVGSGVTIEERRCVEKTWPNWWDDLESKVRLFLFRFSMISSPACSPSVSNAIQIGITVHGVDSSEKLPSTSTLPISSVPASSEASDASIFLIGMRGAGKTWVGEVAASALGWDLIDADVFMKAELGGQELGAFVAEKGWPAFREEEARILKELMEKHSERTIISLGGGVVEKAENREALAKYAKTKGPVVHVVRPVEEVMAFLETTSRPAYGESNIDVYNRRAPWFAECSNFQFFNHTQLQHAPVPTSYPSINTQSDRSEVARFFNFVVGQSLNRPTTLAPPRRSTFLSLTFPELTPALPFLDEITAGADAIELRVDLLSEDHQPVTSPKVPSSAYVSLQLAGLRQATPLPIVFSVRTKSQGGMFPDDAEKEYFALLDLAVRSGCEYVDVEVGFPEKSLAAFVERKGKSHVIASWHNWSGSMRWDGKEVEEKFALCARYGDVAKLVGKANTLDDNFSLRSFVSKATSKSSVPFLAINMGAAGQLSRVLNTVLSPITHPLLPSRAAPGQLSFAEIQRTRHLIGEIPAGQFYLFGSPIAHSMSPILHNTGFDVLGLPHRYSLVETDIVNPEIKDVLASPDFGGANVTIPLKLDIIPFLDTISEHAKVIGAVNTVIPSTRADGSRELKGDNTDWIAIHDLAKARLAGHSSKDSTGLVIGAGGTCRAAIYALHQLGLGTIYLFNRTRANAEKVVASFPSSYNIVVVDSLLPTSFTASPSPPSVIVSTVPGSSSVELPKTLLGSKGGVVIELAMKPFKTSLLQMAEGVEGWSSVPGLSILVAQGAAAFELWTGVRAPVVSMEKKAWEKYLA